MRTDSASLSLGLDLSGLEDAVLRAPFRARYSEVTKTFVSTLDRMIAEWQAEPFAVGLAAWDPGIAASSCLSEPEVPCGGKKHRVRFTEEPNAGGPLAARPSRVGMYIDLMDPIHFDPIDQWSWGGTVTVVRR